MSTRFFFILLILFAWNTLNAQQHHWVHFNDKVDVSFDPEAYFDQKAIERREKQGIALYDFHDLPVNSSYVNEVRSLSDSILAVSRWFNAVVIKTDENRLARIRQLPYVKRIIPVSTGSRILGHKNMSNEAANAISLVDSMMAIMQTERMKGSYFTGRGYTGKGIRIAIFDVGFPNVNHHPAFKHIMDENRLIRTYDFIKKDSNVFRSQAHGTSVMSCIGGKYDSIHLGLALDAEFMLARTERILTEFVDEEYNWVMAAEWADKHGADIINSSLGYTNQRYFPEEMTGKESYVAHAANIAASKGILVVNSAGNEGENSWITVVSPADADSVLSVGGTDPFKDIAIGFSSYGPTADGDLKPNVSAYGVVLAASKKGYAQTQGTSFASPLVAGFAACAWQAHPGLTNMQLFDLLQRSGHLYPYYDYSHGYGIPQADKVLDLYEPVAQNFELQKEGDSLLVMVDSLYIKPDSVDAGDWPRRNLYFHLLHQNGELLRYGVVLVRERKAWALKLEDYPDLKKIMIHFEGYTYAIDPKNIEHETP